MDSEENTTFDNNDDVLEDASEVDNITLEEVLISLVQIRPPLWNSCLPVKERSKTIRDNLWMEIYKELGGGARVLHPVWRRSQDKEEKVAVFDVMSFLNDSLDYRPTISHLTNTTECTASSPNPTPSESVTLKRRLKCSSTSSTEEAIIGALNRINTPVEITPPDNQSINPICMNLNY
ncbi:hypothetical protein RN001_001941 [Aquatica leii]|uniref:MADF domain-containing protein n=1 Tax=Aquatica leii TaxID=1421715 RepID=A0AAN7PCM6_9COLE|nr:hypothetical protein RN001_001941 [Aquatica leii]